MRPRPFYVKGFPASIGILNVIGKSLWVIVNGVSRSIRDGFLVAGDRYPPAAAKLNEY